MIDYENMSSYGLTSTKNYLKILIANTVYPGMIDDYTRILAKINARLLKKGVFY